MNRFCLSSERKCVRRNLERAAVRIEKCAVYWLVDHRPGIKRSLYSTTSNPKHKNTQAKDRKGEKQNRGEPTKEKDRQGKKKKEKKTGKQIEKRENKVKF